MIWEDHGKLISVDAELSKHIGGQIYAGGVALTDHESNEQLSLSWAEIEKLIEIFNEHRSPIDQLQTTAGS